MCNEIEYATIEEYLARQKKEAKKEPEKPIPIEVAA